MHYYRLFDGMLMVEVVFSQELLTTLNIYVVRLCESN